MIALLLVSVSPIIIKFLMGDVSKNKSKKNIYLTICGLCIIFVMGLRSRLSGTTDTKIYCDIFDRVRMYYLSLGDYIASMQLENGFLFSEVGFSIYVWALARIFSDAQWLLIVSAVIMTVCTLKFISKHSGDVTLSLVMFLCLGLFTFNMSGLRQCIAMSICLLAYDFIKEKKFIPFVLILILAMSFHKSALIFGFSFLLIFIKPKLNHVLVFLTALALFIAFADDISFLYDSLTGEDYSGGESFDSGGYITIAIYLIIIVVTLLFNKNWNNSQLFLPLLLTVVGVSLYVIRYTSVQIYERISYYFYFYTILLLPSVISKFESKSKVVINAVVSILSIVLLWYRVSGGVFQNFTLIF